MWTKSKDACRNEEIAKGSEIVKEAKDKDCFSDVGDEKKI